MKESCSVCMNELNSGRTAFIVPDLSKAQRLIQLGGR